MKKLLLILLFLFNLPVIFAQARIRPGIKIGVNQSTLSNLEMDYRTGLYLGAFAHIRFSEIYTMQPEIMYSSQGGRSRANSAEDLQINYISIDLANKLFVSSNFGFHIIVGPSLDLNYDNNPISWVNDDFSTNNQRLTGFDLAFFGGIGYEFPNGLILEARYKQGMVDIDLWNNDFNNNGQNIFNRVFQFGAAYKFGL
ncbi:MAG: PorT family protein [Maribacter sp.]|nr:PorT family protein [Maribacter sp.]